MEDVMQTTFEEKGVFVSRAEGEYESGYWIRYSTIEQIALRIHVKQQRGFVVINGVQNISFETVKEATDFFHDLRKRCNR
jgi:hypothetical protein